MVLLGPKCNTNVVLDVIKVLNVIRIGYRGLGPKYNTGTKCQTCNRGPKSGVHY